MIIGLVGPKQSGKDTFADYLCEKKGTFQKVAFASTLKHICQEIFSLSDAQLHDPNEKEKIDGRWGKTPRQILQIVGTDLFRTQFDNNIWIKSLKHKLQNIPPSTHLIFTDIRFQNELDFVLEFANSEPVYIFEISRPMISDGDTHISETSKLFYDFIIPIANDGSKSDFFHKIDKKLNEILK